MGSSQNETTYSEVTVKTNVTIFIAIDSIVAFLTVVCNGIFLIALKKSRSLHTPTNILFGALSLSDLFVGLVVQPLWIFKFSYILANKDASSFDYPRFVITWFAIFLSFVYIMSVSVDRYVAICSPFWYHAKATCKSHLYIAAAILSSSIVLYSLGQLTFALGSPTAAGYTYYTFMGVSLVVTGFCNLRIFYVSKKQKKSIGTLESSLKNAENTQNAEGRRFAVRRIQENNKHTIIVVITTLFFACYLPFLVETVREKPVGFDNKSRSTLYMDNIWSDLFLLLNSLVNPVVYYARMQAFRKAVKNVLCKKLNGTS